MDIKTVSPAHLRGNELRCEHCLDYSATHIELSADGNHDATEHLVVCGKCAYLAGLKISGLPVVHVHILGYVFDLIPVVAPSCDVNYPGGASGTTGPGGIPRRLYLQPGGIQLVAHPDRRAS